MKIDLIIAPIEKHNIKWMFVPNNKDNNEEINKYYQNGLNEELREMIKKYKFENIYMHANDAKNIKGIKVISYNKSVGELINNDVQHNFFFFNNFTAKFFAQEDNIFRRYVNIYNNDAVIACPSTYNSWWTSNASASATTLNKTKSLYEKYFANNDQISQEFGFVNFNFAFFDINYAKEIKFATKLNAIETIIDYYYRLETNNIKVTTDLNSLIFNNAMHIKPYALSQVENTIDALWSKNFLHIDQYKKVYAKQFWDYILAQDVKKMSFVKKRAIMYVTTPFNWVNGMTKHVRDLINNNKDKHVYVFESPSEPRLSNKFYLNHFYNGKLINIETIDIIDFNNLSKLNSVAYDQAIEKILLEKNISLVHIHILALGHKHSIAKVCKNLNVPTILSVHDLYYIGGEYTQENINNQFDDQTLKDKYKIENINSFKENWTNSVQELFHIVDKIVFFTEKYIDLYSNFYYIDESKCEVIEHGSIYNQTYKLANTNNKQKVFNLLYFGRIRKEKGILNLIEYAKKCDNIHIYVVGTNDEEDLFKKIKDTKNIEYVSPFSSFEQLVDIVKKLNIHAKIIPANWHESFNFTLSEAILLGLYPIVYNFGALSSRLEKYQIGSVLNSNTPSELNNLIKQIQNLDELEWASKLNDVQNTHIQTIEQMSEKYKQLYANLMSESTKINSDFIVDKNLHKKAYNNENDLYQIAKMQKLNHIIWHPKLKSIRKTIYKFRTKV